MITVFDIETTFQIKEWGTDPSPYDPENKLVSIGWENVRERDYLCIYHTACPPTPEAKSKIQGMLSSTSLLIAHNIKFDLSWLFELGYTYEGAVWCTMNAEYVLARGQKLPLSLAACCERRGLSEKKVDLIEEYMEKKISFEHIPWNIVEEYGRQDITSCKELAFAQMKELGYEVRCW